jgi:hypothetical protein
MAGVAIFWDRGGLVFEVVLCRIAVSIRDFLTCDGAEMCSCQMHWKAKRRLTSYRCVSSAVGKRGLIRFLLRMVKGGDYSEVVWIVLEPSPNNERIQPLSRST